MSFAVLMIILLASSVLLLRGGELHNHLVCTAEGILHEAGFTTHQEHPQKLSDGRLDFIDLLAQRDDFVLCIEVELSARYVISNAAKAQQLNLPLIVVVPTKRVQKAVRKKLAKTNLRPGGHRICIPLLRQLKQEVTNCFPCFPSVNAGREDRKSGKQKESDNAD